MGFIGLHLGKGLKHADLGAHAFTATQLLWLPVWYLLVIGVHELGHLAGGKLRGMRFLLLVVGPFLFSRTPKGIRMHGLSVAMPDQSRPLRPQMLSMIAGGPIASLALAFAGVAVFIGVGGLIGAHGILVAVFSLLIFAVTALPGKMGGYMTDGRQFIDVWRGGQAVITRQRLTLITAQSLSGVRPRDWTMDGPLLPEPDAPGIESLQWVAFRQLAFAVAQDCNDAPAMAEHAAWLAEHYTDYPLGFQQGLTLELGLYHVMQGDVTAARHWHALSKGGMVDKSRRALFEACLAAAEGNTALAQENTRKGRKYLNKGMDPGMAVVTEEQLLQLERKLAALT